MPETDGMPQRFRWLNDKLDQSLQRLKQTLDTTASIPVDDWQHDWSRYRSSVIDRLELIETALRQLLPDDESLRFKLVGPRDDDWQTPSFEAA
jgi:hypothetical protein